MVYRKVSTEKMLIFLFGFCTLVVAQYRPLGCDVDASIVKDFNTFLDNPSGMPAYHPQTDIFTTRVFLSSNETSQFDPKYKSCSGRSLSCQFYFKRSPRTFSLDARGSHLVVNNTEENCKNYVGVVVLVNNIKYCKWTKDSYTYQLPINDYVFVVHKGTGYYLSAYNANITETQEVFQYNNYVTKVVIPCHCSQQCTVLIQAAPHVVISDGVIRFSDISIKELNNVDAALASHYNTSHSRYIPLVAFKPKRPELALVAYDFNAKLMLYVRGQFGPETHRRVYCTRPLTVNTLVCDPEIHEGLFINPQGQITVRQGGNIYPDPEFIAPDITRHPTVGSCKTVGGYRFAGNYAPAGSEPGYCRTPSTRDQCFTDMLEPSIHVFTVPKNIYGPRLSCEQLCVNPYNCLLSERQSPLWQVCLNLLRVYENAVYVQYDDAQQVNDAFNRTHMAQVNIKAVQFLQATSLEQKAKIENKVKQFIDYFKGWSKHTKYPLPDHGVAQQMLLFIDLAYNNEHDMNTIAALPWLAGWRFGTQLNAVNYAISTIFESLSVLADQINANNIHITQAINTINEQVYNNYNSIVSVYNALKGSILQLASDLKHLSEQVYTIEYVAAKLSQIQAQVAQAEREKQKIGLDMRILHLQKAACDDKLLACLPGPGIYLSHYVVESDVATSLIVHYLKPDRCSYAEVSGFKCHANRTFVASYGCHYKDDVLTSWINSTCQETIIPGCQHIPKDLQLFQLNQFLTPVTKRQYNYTAYHFNQTLEDIKTYRTVVKEAVDKVQNVRGITLADTGVGLGTVFQRSWFALTFWQFLGLIVGAGLVALLFVKLLLNKCCGL
nr:spike protein [Serpentovirales sp.]